MCQESPADEGCHTRRRRAGGANPGAPFSYRRAPGYCSEPQSAASAVARVVFWDGLTPGDWVDHLEGSDVCINLTGRSVNCRYTAANRRVIYESRTRSTQLLNGVIASLKRPPRLWINASTATIYRHALDRATDEANGELGGNEAGAPDTWNFSIAVAKGWEEAFFAGSTPGTRKVAIRSAMTFSPDRKLDVFDVFLRSAGPPRAGRQAGGRRSVCFLDS